MNINKHARLVIAVLCLFASVDYAYALQSHQRQAQVHQQPGGWCGRHKAGCTIGTMLICALVYLGWRTYKNWHRNLPAQQPANPLNAFLAHAHHDEAIGRPAPVAAQPNQRHVIFLKPDAQAGHAEPFGNIHFFDEQWTFRSLEDFADHLAQAPDRYAHLVLSRELNQADGAVNLHLYPAQLLEEWVSRGKLTNPSTNKQLQEISCYRLQRDLSNPNHIVLVADPELQVATGNRVIAKLPNDIQPAVRNIVGHHLDNTHRRQLNGPVTVPFAPIWPTYSRLPLADYSVGAPDTHAAPARDEHRRIIFDDGQSAAEEFIMSDDGEHPHVHFNDFVSLADTINDLANRLFGEPNRPPAQLNAAYEQLVVIQEDNQRYLFTVSDFEDHVRHTVENGLIRNPSTNNPIQNLRYYRLQRVGSDQDYIRLVADPNNQIAGHARVAAHTSDHRRPAVRNLWRTNLSEAHVYQINHAILPAPPAQAIDPEFAALLAQEAHAGFPQHDVHVFAGGHEVHIPAHEQEQHRHWWQPRHWLETVAEIGLAILVSTAGGR